MRKKRILWAGYGLIALATVWFAFLRPREEPKYQGRYLSEWVTDCGPDPLPSCEVIVDDPDPAQTAREKARAEATHAVQAIGTNALPYFLEWIRYRPAAWQRTLRDKLPRWLMQKKVVGDWLGDVGFRRAEQTVWGIESLGTKASGAVPALATMMNDGTNLHCANLAFRTLSRMGEPAIPAFQAAFADTNAPYRRDAFFHACAMDHKLGRTNATVPILTAALHDQDPVVRDTAEVWLRQFQEDGLIKAKAE